MLEQTKEWGGKHALAYQRDTNIPIDIHYGPGSPNEDELQLIGSVEGKYVLELGCGGAQCSIAFAKRGAIVTAIDVAQAQVAFAKKLADQSGVKIDLYQRDIADLTPILDKSQDVVFSACTFAYVDDLIGCFKEVSRVLKDDGTFVWSLGHPFFGIADPKTLKLRTSYFETGVSIEGEETGSAFAFVRRTVSDYFNTAVEAGFIVEKMIEPDSRKRYPYDPWYGLWNDYTPQLMEKMPATIIFKCRKR